ncbi:MAG TPA: ABC transporter substrate-binding protein [Candidatus Limnocylindrales bacterium]|nr:ABC transporter substrate-binding protein [Candidatus Limnocylindrales bacterium]
MRHPRNLLAASLAVVLALSTAACNSAADDQPDIQPGGTLRIAAPSLPANLDPQRIAAALEANISRVISRTLTTFKAESGTASGELVADLATDLGRPRDNNKIWSFKLKDGLKWADGSPITCQHLKYGAERNFATIAKNNLPYARTYLADNPTPYKGPGVNGNQEGLASVVCLDPKTIEYHLKFPVGDFNYAVALAVFAPVKQGAAIDDTQYNLEPLASGPYKVKPGRTAKDTEMTLVRNEHWSSATDKVRKAYPDQIIISAANTNVPSLTNSIIEDEGDAKDTIMLMDVSANFVQQVMTDPKLQARTASGPSGLVRYLSINTKKITNEKCRQALLWAFNKRKFRQAMGGSLIGDMATTMLSPTLKAHQKFDHYGVFTNGGEGNPQEALKLIAQAKEQGVTCPTRLVLAHPDQPTTTNRFVKTVVDAYIEIGVQVQLQPLPVGPYFDTIKAYEAHAKYDLLWAGWIPDWSNGSAVIPPLFGSDAVAKEPGVIGGSNTSFLEDPEIDKAIQDANLETSIERQWKLWGEIDSKLQQKAVSIPIIYGKAIRLHGSNVGGAYIHSALGMPDIASLGLLKPGGAAQP